MSLVLDAVETLLAERVTPAAVRALEAGGAAAPLWAVLADAGYLELLAPESAGGAGLAWHELREVVVAIGRHAAPLPWAQGMALRWLLRDAAAASPALPAALAPEVRADADGWLGAARVPWGRDAALLVANIDDELMLVPAEAAERRASEVPGSLAAAWRWRPDAMRPCAVRGRGESLRLVAAALHAALLAGAMQRSLELTVRYAAERTQFGKPIAAFQAIQQQLAVMAEEVAAAGMAAAAAFAPGHDGPTAFGAAVAKSRCSEAAAEVAAIAHAVHGAIGITAEYDLQLYTRRLHEWRVDHGAESHWNQRLGEAMLAGSSGVAEAVRGLG